MKLCLGSDVMHGVELWLGLQPLRVSCCLHAVSAALTVMQCLVSRIQDPGLGLSHVSLISPRDLSAFTRAASLSH